MDREQKINDILLIVIEQINGDILGNHIKRRHADIIANYIEEKIKKINEHNSWLINENIRLKAREEQAKKDAVIEHIKNSKCESLVSEEFFEKLYKGNPELIKRANKLIKELSEV